MTTYTKTTDFLAKDSLLTGNPSKKVKGSEIDAEFNNLATADADNVKASSLGSGVAAFLATPSSANLAAAVTGETGTGALVFATSPTLVTPALGTPASGTLTNCTGLPVSTGVSGLGTGVATALAIAVDSAGSFVKNGSVLGTPSGGTLTNCTGLPVSTGVSGLGAGVATFLATPSSANLAAAVTGETGSGALVFADSCTLTTPTLGVASATSINKVAITAPATSATLTIANGKTLTASNTLTLAGTDSTTITFQGTDTYVGRTTTDTLTNKRVTARVGSTTSSATPTINTDNVDIYKLTAQAVDITSFTTNLSGTPTDGQVLIIQITGTAARAITWGTSFEASTVSLPTTTVSTNMLTVGFLYNGVTSKWRCMAAV